MIDKYESFLRKKKLYINNPTLYLLIFMVIGYSIKVLSMPLYVKLSLDPYMITKGEVWRIFSWLLVNDLNFNSITNILFGFISLFFYYFIGRNVEREFGTVKYNIFLQFGIILTIIGHFLLYGFLSLTSSYAASLISMENSFQITNSYLLQTLFLIWAYLNPESKINLYFVIPIKVKYMALVYLILTGFNLITGGMGVKITIICAFINLFIFFINDKKPFRKTKKIKPKTFMHKCAVCGKTSDDSSQFRFCSKCSGEKEYCLEHIKNHTHN